MKYPVIELPRERYPPKLLEIPDPPRRLFVRGELPAAHLKTLAVVGARNFSDYGKEACEELLKGLRGQPVVIVSGLALGIDSIAHRAALEAKLPTVAIPGSGLDPQVIYPASHRALADEILEAGGCLLSEFVPHYEAVPISFPQRNRIMAGFSDATLIIEAERKSGTMITARMATEYNRELLTVPGSIFSRNSEGPHLLIRMGATPVTCPEDILEALGLKPAERTEFDPDKYKECSPEEMEIIQKLRVPISRDDLLENISMPVSRINGLLTILELKDFIKEAGGEIFLK